LKATRLFLLQEKRLTAGETKAEDHLLAWMNALSRDMSLLGLKRRVKDITPSLDSYIASKSDDGGDA
jgi:hypothetical protein